jgi:DNA polymerase-3 subunit gamma/tau
MAAQVLYRKWRPQRFDQVVGQKHVVQTLRNALAADDVAHAYLFAGPRGTGKTTIARLLAKAVNCLSQEKGKPCNECAICRTINEGRLLDLIEIDAASNRGIDEIRDLRTKVNFSPTQTQFKVYILDEAHMLTNEAFNALLKTLEEPPGHVIFVLVTTEPHRLPATITSRCQRFDFHRLSVPDIVGELQRIAESEGLSPASDSEEVAQRSALELIAQSATGSLRDAISLLDQVITAGGHKVSLDQVQKALGIARVGAAADMVSFLIAGTVGPGLALINQVTEEGADPRQFTAQIVEYLHGLMLLKVADMEPSVPADSVAKMREQAAELSTEEILRTLRLFAQAERQIRSGSPLHLPLEMALVESILDSEERRGEVVPTSSRR